MQNNSPSFTIIIATHNRPQLLDRALQSIHQQTYPCKQVIVISDTNDAETYITASKWMHSEHIFIQRTGKSGPAESRNIGIILAKGDYFIFLDDDDTFQPDFLQNIVNELKTNENKKIYYTNFDVITENDDTGKYIVTNIQHIDIGAYESSSVYVKNFIPNNCLIFPNNLIGHIFFDPEISYEDWDFILNAEKFSNLKHLPIFGPNIHKNTSERWNPRGKENNSGLLDCYLKVYAKHPPKNSIIASQRRDLFSSIGLNIDEILPTSY